jgi:capsular exopolysaccharide synthesis family protein
MTHPKLIADKRWLEPIDTDGRPFTEPSAPAVRGVFDAVRRHRLLMASTVLLTIALGVAYTIYATPIYEATTLVRFEAQQVDLPELVQLPYTDNLINTEMEVLRGRNAAAAVIDTLGLRASVIAPRRGKVSELFAELAVSPTADSQTIVLSSRKKGEFVVSRPNGKAPLGVARVGDTTRLAGVRFVPTKAAAAIPQLTVYIAPQDAAIASFTSLLELARPARDADLIAIRVRNSDPVRAAAAANYMAKNLIADRSLARKGRTSSAVAFLEQQDDSLGRQLHAAEESLRAYQQREHVIDVPQQASAEVTRLAKLQADLASVRAERDAFKGLVDQFRHDTAGGSLGGQSASRRLMAFPALLANQSASTLLGDLAQVESQRSQLLIHRTPDDSDVRVLTGRIHEMEGQLQDIAESYLQSLSNQVGSLEGEAGKFSTQLDALPEKELQTARRQRDTKVLNDLWVLVQTRLKEAQMTTAGGDPTVRIADAASPPTTPIRPRPLVNLGLAAILGCLLGATAVLARDYTDRSIRSRADALSAVGLPVLGAFPRLKLPRHAPALRPIVANPEVVSHTRKPHVNPERNRTASSIASLLVTQPDASPAYVESINQLYVNLALTHHEHPIKVIVFTSALPGEGKSLSAINFALVGASRGQRVLLIDADLRCGVVSSVMGIRHAPGFAEILSGKATFEDAIHLASPGQYNSLVVLPSGMLPKVPGRILTIDRVREVLGQIAPDFDIVVIDSPPINLLADAALLGSAADAVILVVRVGHTQVEDLRFAMDQLDSTRAPVIGTLLNDIDLRRNSRDDGSYRYLAAAARYNVSAT